MNKKFLKDIIPPFIVRHLTGFFYGWHGNFKDWKTALEKCTGYNYDLIFEKVRLSAMKVKTGEIRFERDSVAFNEIRYNFAVLAALMWIGNTNNNRIRVLDFGGSLGSIYYQNRFFLSSLSMVKWCIVEQPRFVEIGKRDFSTDELLFYNNIDECLADTEIDVVLLSSVLPYISEPYVLLEKIKSKKIRFLLFDKMPLIKGPDRITIQKVKPSIYKASYPCWFFNKTKFLEFFKPDYDLVFDFDNTDSANINSDFKGYLYCINTIGNTNALF